MQHRSEIDPCQWATGDFKLNISNTSKTINKKCVIIIIIIIIIRIICILIHL